MAELYSKRQIESKKNVAKTKPNNFFFSTTNVVPVGMSYSTLTKNRSRSAYTEILDKLKKEFQTRFESKKTSSDEGLDTFERLKTLGTGSFGVVYLVRHKETNGDQYYAMKCMEKLRIIKLKQIDHSLYEKKILEAIRHPFIVSMEYSFKDNSYLYFIMPFVTGGELFSHLRRMRRFTEGLSKFYAAQVLMALEFLHYCDILYRDLKPENILVDQTGYLKIADLGFCKIVKGRTWTLCGTPEYIAPEIVLSKGYGKAVDWWSFGVLLYEMDAGYPPFTSSDPMRVYERIIGCRYKCPGSFTAELQDLIRNLLQIDLSKRYGNLRNGVQDIKNHAWFRDIDFLAIYNKQVDAPFKPNVKSPNDTSQFDKYDEVPLKVSDTDLFKKEFEKF